MADDHDPLSPPERTQLRPRPGGGRRAGGDPVARPHPIVPAAFEADAISEVARSHLGVGLNPLVRAASPLLMLAGQLRGSISPMDVAGLRGHALDEIRRFEELARSVSISNDIVLAARYVLCASLDEAVLSTPWGSQSEWAQHPLLVALHREAWGGEKFFDMLDRISADPARYLDLMELQYLALAFGFGGKYAALDRGYERLAAIQQDLYRKIRSHRGTPHNELSLRWHGLEDRRNPLIRYVPWWVIGAAALAILAIAYTAYYAGLANWAEPVHAELAKVGIDDEPPAVTAPVAGPTLKQLLAPEEANGTMRVDEEGGRTLVTLLAPDLFASGSATVSQAHDDTLQRLARALNQVPGRVRVVGHTDDQAVRSLRYRDNYELSRERALGVVKALQLGMENHARMSGMGVGSSEPRYRPESEPANRARNRRVEIIHIRGL